MGSQDTKCRPTKWADLSDRQRVALVVTSILQFLLAGAAWSDLRRRDADEIRGPKWRWGVAIAVNWVGPLSYFVWGRRPRTT